MCVIVLPVAAVWLGARGGWPMRPLLVKTLAVMLVTGLVLTIFGSGVFVVAVRAGIAPGFDQRIALSAQHILVLHSGPQPSCIVIPNPPQHDCFEPIGARRGFSIYYLTPQGARVVGPLELKMW